MLRIENLGKRFGGKPALTAVTAEIADGSFVGVIGRSGAGKSTLLRCINRLVDPSEGRIVFEGKTVTELRGQALRDWRSSCGMIFQQFNLAGRLDVLTNVLMGRINSMSLLPTLLKAWPEAEKLRALAALERLDLGELAGQRAESLSGGQQQRVAIARTLVQNPRIILADEPVASLDPRNTQIVMNALRDLNREKGITVLCNLHSIELSRTYCSRLLGMREGRIVFDGPPEELTPSVIDDLYGFEANDVRDTAEASAQYRKDISALQSAA
jgi:phosphonate transport system ATP-binding protein